MSEAGHSLPIPVCFCGPRWIDSRLPRQPLGRTGQSLVRRRVEYRMTAIDLDLPYVAPLIALDPIDSTGDFMQDWKLEITRDPEELPDDQIQPDTTEPIPDEPVKTDPVPEDDPTTSPIDPQ